MLILEENNGQGRNFDPTRAKENSKFCQDASKDVYLRHYLEYREFLKNHKTESISESTLLAYLQHLMETKSVTSCWTIYSCLKKMIRVNDGIDISRWPLLTDVLKTKSTTHKKKKAHVFKREEIDRFLKDAPDDQFLEDKLALLLGLHGGLRTEEFLILMIEDIETRQDYLKVTVRQRKTDQAGNGSTFIAVKNETQYQCPLYYFQLYLKGRSQLSSKGRIFMQKRKGKFTNQVSVFHKFPVKSDIRCSPTDVLIL